MTHPHITAFQNLNRPRVCLTAYTTPMAQSLAPHCDLLLVGDSVGMALYGMDNTVGVTLDMMINHGKAVMRAATDTLIVVDMPYGSYEHDRNTALTNAQRIMDETQCHAVKLEGGQDMADTIAHLVTHGIAVMGHIGLQPQSVEKEGGYKIKGKTDASRAQLMQDAQAVEDAGAFSIVIEGTIEAVSAELSQALTIPTIGIGASAACDGQILVTDDMLGLLHGHTPKFAKQYVQLAKIIDDAAQRYAAEVKSRAFPSSAYVYGGQKT